MLYLAATLLAACSRGPMPDESSNSAGLYQLVNEQQASSLLRVDWKGEGRDINSGRPVDVPEADVRRKTYIDIDFASPGPMLWRSNLERRLKTERLTPGDIRTEPLESFSLIRATIVIEPGSGEFFFKPGVGPDLDGRYYVAQCSTPYAWEKGAVHCSTQLKVESFTVKIMFDRAFLWDFDNLLAQALEAAKHHIAKPSTQRLIKRLPSGY